MKAQNLFFDLMSNVFGIDYRDYLTQNHRGLCTVLSSETSLEIKLVDSYNISPQAEEQLLVAVNQRGRVDSLAGYYTPSMDHQLQGPINHDVLIVSDKLRGDSEKQQVATIYHEACHCYRECLYLDESEQSSFLEQGRKIRKFTYYHDDERGRHDDQWFALLAAKARKVRELYPGLFKSTKDVVETSLKGDWTGETMEDVEWSELEESPMINGLKPYPEYKDSGQEWLGSLPAHWGMLRAKVLFREVDDRSITGKEEMLSVSHLTGVTPRSQKIITMFLAKSNVGHKVCQPNDLVINTMWAWMGALGVARHAGIVSPAYGIYRLLDGARILPRYADYLLRTPFYANEYERRSTGVNSSRLRLYPDKFLRMPVIVPPTDEQAVVVRFLDYAKQ